MSIDNSHKISGVRILLAKGIDGVGIESIEKTGTSGLDDTYTITYTDSRRTTFTIRNGNGIKTITKTGTSGLTDTYTITFDDDSTEEYTVNNGRGIVSIEKTGTSGAVDTYTITYNDNTTSTYTVTNGQGATAGDISFTDHGEGSNNVQGAVDNVLNLVAPIQLTLTADKTYNTGEQFVYNGLLYEVTATIAQGTTITIGSNVQLADTVAEQLSEINSKLSNPTPDVEYTPTSSITFTQALNNLFALIDTTKLTPNTKLTDGVGIYSICYYTPTRIQFGRYGTSASHTDTLMYDIQSSGSRYVYFQINSNNTVNYSDQSNTTFSGTLSIYY